MSYAVGLDIGGTLLKVAAVTGAGEVIHQARAPVQTDRPDWPNDVATQLRAVEQRHGRAAHVGVAAPGIARPDGRGIWWMQGRLAGLEGLDWTTFLGRPAPTLNDAQAALLGEAWIGAAAGQANVVLLTLGTGVGGAAMVDGRLLRGAVGRAGHLGHVSLDPAGAPDITNCPGSLEAAVGNYTLAARAGGRYPDTGVLAAAVADRIPEAIPLWAALVRALAAGIVSAVNVLDPETVVVGGGIAATAGHLLFEPLAEELDRMEWRPHGHRVRVVPAALGGHAGAIGAARNAMVASR